MTGPEFDDITGGDSPDTSSGSNKTRTSAKKLRIKGRYGTKTYTNTDGCQVCGRNADALIIVGVVKENPDRIPKDVIQVCDPHEGDVRGDIEYPPEVVQRVDY